MDRMVVQPAVPTQATLGGEDDDEASLMPSMVCMSVVDNGTNITFAAYHEEQSALLLESCNYDTSSRDRTIESVLAAVRPNLVLIPAKIARDADMLSALTVVTWMDASAPTLQHFDQQSSTVIEDVESGHVALAAATIPYRLQKSSAYDVERCRGLILHKLRVRTLAPDAVLRPQAHNEGPGRHFPLADSGTYRFQVSSYNALAAIVDFESDMQVKALGSLIGFLVATGTSLDEGARVTVADIKHLKTSSFMNLSPATLAVLQVFATEHHPIVASQGTGNSKEGCSLFSLLDHTKSKVGRQKLKDWMRRPLLDLADIENRQAGVELFTLPEFHSSQQGILGNLGSVGAVDKMLTRIKRCCVLSMDLLIMMRTIAAGVNICTTLQHEILWKLGQRAQPQLLQMEDGTTAEIVEPQAGAHYEFVEKLLLRCRPSALRNTLERMNAVIDDESSAAYKSVVIRRGYSPQLDAMKEQYGDLEGILHDCQNAIGDRVPHVRGMMRVVFLPQIGFLVELRNEGLAASLPDDFLKMFVERSHPHLGHGMTGVGYYKNAEVGALDDSLGDLDSDIKDVEKMLVAQLEDDILDRERDLRDTFDAIAELDCVISFAKCATAFDFVKPTLLPASECRIEIIQGRHPLQEMICENRYVPNDSFVDTENRVNIVTGPNFSGKSCYARQVGVLVYMAHVGSFVPCDAARMSLTDKILTHFSMAESCSVPQSSFQLDLSRMGGIMRQASAHSLVLIDEFGKGTNPSSGIALLTAAIQKLGQIGAKVICTTHFLEIFSMSLLRDGENDVRALHMAVKLPATANELAIPTFRLERGVSSSSAGIACAKLAGVKKAVIERAQEIVDAQHQRRQVEPLTEILHRELGLSEKTKAMLLSFIGTDWDKASVEDIDRFIAMHSKEQ